MKIGPLKGPHPTEANGFSIVVIASNVTRDWQHRIFAATATTNSNPFRRFNAGTLVLAGCSSTRLANNDWELEFKFIPRSQVAGALNATDFNSVLS